MGAEEDNTLGIEHWPVQGAAGLALGACAAAMAFWVPGRPLLRLTVSLSATLIGAADLAYPDRAGAMDGPLWGVATVIWGTAVALPLPSRVSGPGQAPGRTPLNKEPGAGAPLPIRVPKLNVLWAMLRDGTSYPRYPPVPRAGSSPPGCLISLAS